MIDSIQVSPDDPDFKRILNKRLEEIGSLLGRSSAAAASSQTTDLHAGTNKQRLSIPAGSLVSGATFWETDTKTLYVVDESGGGHVWALASGGGSGSVAYASGTLTLLAATPNDIPGTSITLPASGDYLITGIFDFWGTGAGDSGSQLRGYLNTNGTTQSKIAYYTGTFGFTTTAATVAQQWIYTATAGQVVKLQADKNAGTGASTANLESSISALLLRP